jgi:hypothetical protein
MKKLLSVVLFSCILPLSVSVFACDEKLFQCSNALKIYVQPLNKCIITDIIKIPDSLKDGNDSTIPNNSLYLRQYNSADATSPLPKVQFSIKCDKGEDKGAVKFDNFTVTLNKTPGKKDRSGGKEVVVVNPNVNVSVDKTDADDSNRSADNSGRVTFTVNKF